MPVVAHFALGRPSQPNRSQAQHPTEEASRLPGPPRNAMLRNYYSSCCTSKLILSSRAVWTGVMGNTSFQGMGYAPAGAQTVSHHSGPSSPRLEEKGGGLLYPHESQRAREIRQRHTVP